MASKLNPYVVFREGNAEEALNFYQQALGGELDISRFGEYGMEGAQAEQVMHGQLETPAGFTLMASDLPPGWEATAGSSISVSLSGDDQDELRGYWDKLSEGGTVSTPLEKQMWGDFYGDFTDRFGVRWLVNIAGEHPEGEGTA